MYDGIVIGLVTVSPAVAFINVFFIRTSSKDLLDLIIPFNIDTEKKTQTRDS